MHNYLSNSILQTGAKIIAIIYSLFIGGGTIIKLGLLLKEDVWSNASGSVFDIAIYAIILSCLWYGILRERAAYLIPFIILMVLL